MNGTHPSDEFLSPDHVAVLKRTMLSAFTEDEQESFIVLCQRNKLDPFNKEVFATRRYVKDRSGNKVPTLVPVTSLLGLTGNAIRSGQYDGCVTTWAGKDGAWRDEWLEEEFPVAAKCVVYHKGRTHPEVGIATWAGYCGQSYNNATKRWEVSEFWERLGPFMLAKCAKAQALRGAFPELNNLYISEELQGGISEADQYDDEAKIAKNRAKEEELLKKAKAEGVRIVESKPVKQPTVKQPTPAEAAAPMPEPPVPVQQAVPAPAQVPNSAPQEMPEDDLDMEPSQPPQEEVSAAPPPGPPAWKEHVIAGLRNDKFLGRKVGDLSPAELAAITTNWVPKVRAVWDTVKQSQKDDALAFEAAIENSKLERPW